MGRTLYGGVGGESGWPGREQNRDRNEPEEKPQQPANQDTACRGKWVILGRFEQGMDAVLFEDDVLALGELLGRVPRRVALGSPHKEAGEATGVRREQIHDTARNGRTVGSAGFEPVGSAVELLGAEQGPGLKNASEVVGANVRVAHGRPRRFAVSRSMYVTGSGSE